MPGLKICRSNRSERLALGLAKHLRGSPLENPIAADPVVVHSQGMGRWLSMILSQEIGICANVEFSFPAKVFRMAMARALDALDRRDRAAAAQETVAPADPDEDPWDPDRVTWVLLRVLPELHGQLDPALRDYLEQGADGTVHRKEYQLARRLANLFDDYANYRPDWIADWDRKQGIQVRGKRVAPGEPGGADDWQARLWRAVGESIRSPHPASRIDDAIRALSDLTLEIDGLPPRLSLFGISALPPSFVRVLVALSARIDVRLYALSPSHRYFGDMLTDEEAARNLARHIDSNPDDQHDYGHPLLKSLGRLGRDFHLLLTQAEEAALAGHDGGPDPVVEDYEEPGVGGSMLETLQSDILNLRYRHPKRREDEEQDDDEAPVPFPAPDGSIRFHACHGALRQVEVLRDELLRLFKADRNLQARDVVVMSPDIDTFAPLIDAVFSDGEEDASKAGKGVGFPTIDFQISDRSARQTNVAAEVVSRVLGLSAGRFAASDVLDLLSLEPVRRKFGLDTQDLESVHSWVSASGLRWGLDEHHRKAQAQPQDRLNTWRFGLDRLLLGFAMPGDGERTFDGVLPFDDVEGGSARTLGRFVRFCETLFDAAAEIQGTQDPEAFAPGGLPRKPAEWEALVRRVVDSFVDLPAKQYWRISKTLDVFRDLVKNSGGKEAGREFERGLDLDTVRALVDEQMSASGSSAALLAGGVNFCALVPMRTIPFKVVCLLGMDDGGFPRQQRRMGFDLLGWYPATGDRSPRDDDRHLFLEALLAARKNLIVTWNGRSIRDNADLPPAVPVGELLDVLTDSFDLPGDTFKERRESLVAKQHLQAFSIENFRHDGRRSFDRRARDGAAQLLRARKPDPAFFTAELPDLPAGEWVVTVDDLVRFFQNPIRQLLLKRLAVRLDERTDEIEDREPIALDGLEDWAVGDEILKALLKGQDPGTVRQRIRLQGAVPLGVPGDLLLDRIRAEAQKVHGEASSRQGGSQTTIDSTLDVKGLSIRGTLDDVWTTGQVIAQYGTVKSKYVLGAWLKHLLACALDEKFPGVTTLVGRRSKSKSADWKEVVTFRGVEGEGEDLPAKAKALLADLAELYRYGWQRPLLLFPDSSCGYARSFLAAKAGADADAAGRKSASGKWETGESADFKNEDADPYFQRVLQGANPWDEDFDLPGLPATAGFRPEDLALRVWKPILAATRSEKEVKK